MNFPKFVHKHTYGKKVTPKDPLRLNARDLKSRAEVSKFLDYMASPSQTYMKWPLLAVPHLRFLRVVTCWIRLNKSGLS